MSWEFPFTLPARSPLPAGFPALGGHLARHHILGRKYVQFMLALAERVGVSDGTLKRFAGWPVTSGTNAPVQAQFVGMFFWSPFNLFVGPEGHRRVFDPSSGVEQQRPNSFPLNRWTALKELPGYFEGIGVKLSELVSLEDTETATWKITADADKVRVDLTSRIKAVTNTLTSDKVPVHDVHAADWGIVPALSVTNHRIQSYEDVQAIYLKCRDSLVEDVAFGDAVGNDAYRFVMIPGDGA